MKRNNIYSLLLINLCLAMLLPACTKAPDGYLSDNIYFKQYVVDVPRGLPFASYGNNILSIGSTPPFDIQMTHVYDSASGKQMDSVFLKKYPGWIWKGPYNPFTDTTLDLVNKLQQQIEEPAIGLNSAGGRLEATPATANLPLGTYYFDMTVSNPGGKKSYSKVGSFRIVDPPLFNGPSNVTNYLRKVSDESNPSNGKTPKVTITRTSTDLSLRSITLKIVDKNGKPFNPSAGELIQQVDNAGITFYPTLKNFAVGVTYTDSTQIYNFAVTPFPYFLAAGVYSGNSTSVYYRIPTRFLVFDKSPSNLYTANIRFTVNFNVNGAYQVVVKLPDLRHS